jgi:hypothetical protein
MLAPFGVVVGRVGSMDMSGGWGGTLHSREAFEDLIFEAEMDWGRLRFMLQ